MEFLKVESVEAAREKLIAGAKDWLAAREAAPIDSALGRVLAADIISPCDIPAFRRSTVDGWAVVSADTAAAGDGIPALLSVKGRVEIGRPTDFAIAPGECAGVPTGGMLPGGADAVVMIEHAEPFGDAGVALYSGVAHGENIVQAGEDAPAGAPLLRRGKRLRPQDIGVLAAAGVSEVSVFAAPRLSVISTGDELVSPEETPEPGQVRDINTAALCALAQKNGFAVVHTAVLPDDAEKLENALRAAMEISDIAVVSGGSSKGEGDLTAAAIDKVSSPGVFVHGLAVKPGKPTILGLDSPSRTVLAGLPGHPVSAMMVFELLFCRTLRDITGCPAPPAVPARLARNAAASPGMLTCWPAALEWAGGEYTAAPVFGKSGLITTLVKADGYFTVERDTEGLAAGSVVLVHLF